MKTLLNPRSLLLITTTPGLILFYLFYSKFTLIQSLLDEPAKLTWLYFCIALLTLIAITSLYSIYLIQKNLNISMTYALFSLAAYISILYTQIQYYQILIPFSIPEWMVSDEVFFYAGTFLMPTLVHSIFILVAWVTPEKRQNKNWLNFLYAVSVPAFWYLLLQVILPLWRFPSSLFGTHGLTIFFIIGTILFLLFLIRGIYILIVKKKDSIAKFQLLWKVPISLVFPLLGLAINNGLDFKSFTFREDELTGIFGDFNGFWFYSLAILNGIFLCLPNFQNKNLRFILFLLRSVTFSYTFYFFLVFLPYLPLSIFAIIVFGLGFLMLTPLILIVIHTNEIYEDFKFLETIISKKALSTSCLLGILSIPTILTIQYLGDRLTLRNTLVYLYSPNYSEEYTVNRSSLSNTIQKIKILKKQTRSGHFLSSNNKTPYLSSYFNWIVLDNLSLSDVKIDFIEKVFFGNTKNILNENNWNQTNQFNVRISKISTNSQYDTKTDTWTSSIDLEIQNNTKLNLSEFSTNFTLPTGAWISDYYLYIGDRKEKGIHAEKKAAVWVYSQILNIRKDPGILHYTTGNKIAFKVFPFSPLEVRKTGFEIIHKEPIELELDGKMIALGDRKNEISTKLNKNDKIMYISTVEKLLLPKIQRTPYFHFLIDTSQANEKNIENSILKIESILKKNKKLVGNHRFSLVNSYIKNISSSDWKNEIKSSDRIGGFFLDRAIRQTLVQSYNENKNEYPILIVITDKMKGAILDKDFSDLFFTYPDLPYFYELNKFGKFIPHSLSDKSILAKIDPKELNFNSWVYRKNLPDGKFAFLPLDANPEIVLINSTFEIESSEIKSKDWKSGLYLQGKWISQLLHPEISETEWLPIVCYSFISNFLTPPTSYIVLENDAQKEALKRKQEQILSSNQSLDAGEEIQRMSEPNMYLMIGILGFFLVIHRVISIYNKKNMADPL
jgi:hypothetical protein